MRLEHRGSGFSKSFSRRQELPVSVYTKGVLDRRLCHCVGSAEFLLDWVSQGSSQRQRPCQELLQLCSQSVGMKTLRGIWAFLPFPCGFYTCNLHVSADWASLFLYLRLIYSSPAAFSSFPLTLVPPYHHWTSVSVFGVLKCKKSIRKLPCQLRPIQSQAV